MQNYGTIIGGQLFITSVQIDGYKPVIHAEIPTFDESTQYIVQTTPVDEGDRIYVGVEVCSLPVDDLIISMLEG